MQFHIVKAIIGINVTSDTMLKTVPLKSYAIGNNEVHVCGWFVVKLYSSERAKEVCGLNIMADY